MTHLTKKEEKQSFKEFIDRVNDTGGTVILSGKKDSAGRDTFIPNPLLFEICNHPAFARLRARDRYLLRYNRRHEKRS